MQMSIRWFQILWLILPTDGRRFMEVKSTVRKPGADRRQYAYTTLPNGLVHLAIEDGKAAKSGFAVSVSAGSYYDPPALPGLAHFCEHLLFLGTEKYPDESSFDNFLAQHDGENNAFTEQEATVFHNEISHAGFNEGMDRFAQFFIAPLFKQEMVGRELNAVNSEHEKNIPDQFRQMWELMRSTARNTSVVSHFYTGTVESLHHGDNTTVAALKKYHTENYCAPRMRLVTISNKALKEQQEIVHTHFTAVPRGTGHCAPKPRDFGSDQPFDSANLGQFIQVPTQSKPRLWMMFPMPPTLHEYKSQPATLLSYYLGYAGPGSLKGQLKSHDLISDLGVQVDQSSAATMVFLMFDLTATGTKSVSELTSVVFDYLQKARAEDKSKLKQVYSSLQKMNAVTFDFQEAPDSVMESVSNFASSMQNYAPQDVLAGDTLIDTINVDLVSQLLQKLTPDNMNLAIASKDFDMQKANQYNKYYRVHYSEREIPQKMRQPTLKPLAGHLPPALRYVPSQLVVLNASAGKTPRRLDADGADVWWLGHGRFSLPKAQLRLKLTVPQDLFASVTFEALRRLHAELTNTALEEPLEDLGNCGLNLELKETSDGYHFSMDGYSEHIAALAAQAADGFSAPKYNFRQFEQAKQKLLASLEDATSKMPYEHAMEALSVITSNGVFSSKDVIAAVKSTNHDMFKDYLSKVVAKGVRVQLLATGNLNEAQAQSLARTIVSNLKIPRVLTKSESAQSKVVAAKRSVEVRLANPIPGDANSATVNAYQFGVPDVAERVRLLMLGKMISNPAYDELRTKEQLGYVVFATIMPQLETLQLVMIVQGEKKNPDEVDTRIESVMDSFSHNLANLSVQDFTRWKASVRSAIAKDDQNMGQEADRFWAQIASGEECFNRRDLALQFLDSYNSPAELAQEFTFFRHQPKKVSIRLFGNHSLVSWPQPNSTALQVVVGDSIEEKRLAAQGQTYWSSGGICQIHRSV